LATFGLNDDLRDGVPSVIEKLYLGGVNVRMISGDNILTAIEAAKSAGILKAEEEKIDKVCMEGKEFRELVGGTRKVPDNTGEEKWEIVNK
jgi:magnesium-transporting ATPase (P-type)